MTEPTREHIATVLAAIKTLGSTDLQACFVRAMHALGEAETAKNGATFNANNHAKRAEAAEAMAARDRNLAKAAEDRRDEAEQQLSAACAAHAEAASKLIEMRREKDRLLLLLTEAQNGHRSANAECDRLRGELSAAIAAGNAALHANCSSTTIDQIDTVAQQLCKELHAEVGVWAESFHAPAGYENFTPSKTVKYHADVWHGSDITPNTLRAPTLPELAAAVRKWWAERQGREIGKPFGPSNEEWAS